MTCDLEVDVNGEEIFLVDKGVLSSFSGKLRELTSKTLATSATRNLRVTLHGLPGGAEAFELMTRFCYNNGRTQMSPSNICLLHCIAHFMEMTGDLLSLTKKSLQGIPYWSWPEIMSCLKRCQDLIPVASSSGMLDKVICSLVGRITAVSDASPSGSSPETSAFRFSCDTGSTTSAKNSSNHRGTWWFDELVVLNLDMIEEIIRKMAVEKANHVAIGRFLMHYLKNVGVRSAAADKKKAAEVIIDLLYSLDGSSVSSKSLFGLLRVSYPLKLSKCCQTKLESMIGNQFDQATLDNLLIPAPAGMNSLYDVNIILRFLRSFHRSGGRDSANRSKQAGSLMDSYLAEVAPDSSLKPLKFLALITALPDEARDCHDAIYRAIDLYLEVQVHTQISDEEKMKICSAINYEKLSSESCKHIARNTKFPSRTAVRALISQQTKLRSLLKGTDQLRKPGHDPDRDDDDEQIILYAKKLDLTREHEKLKSQLQGMQWKVMELEKMCRKMQRQMSKAMKTRIAGSSGSRSLPRLCS
ncbi:BTB/POZ domain-containing protein At3g22104-like isoform X1 [Musa acuminata AAA Group]|uniref:BTB/POZ domain-containing protein At3g22104-like isoform X1 n=2 Tax=Musa acuminata AAA Group TaxID=214697 RepID=UPI0031DB166D